MFLKVEALLGNGARLVCGAAGGAYQKFGDELVTLEYTPTRPGYQVYLVTVCFIFSGLGTRGADGTGPTQPTPLESLCGAEEVVDGRYVFQLRFSRFGDAWVSSAAQGENNVQYLGLYLKTVGPIHLTDPRGRQEYKTAPPGMALMLAANFERLESPSPQTTEIITWKFFDSNGHHLPGRDATERRPAHKGRRGHTLNYRLPEGVPAEMVACTLTWQDEKGRPLDRVELMRTITGGTAGQHALARATPET